MMTTQRQVRRAFWQHVRELKAIHGTDSRGRIRVSGTTLHLTPRRIVNYARTGTMHNTDTRCAFCDWLDGESKAGHLAEGLADRCTL